MPGMPEGIMVYNKDYSLVYVTDDIVHRDILGDKPKIYYKVQIVKNKDTQSTIFIEELSNYDW